jgi:hypothetical protein
MARQRQIRGRWRPPWLIRHQLAWELPKACWHLLRSLAESRSRDLMALGAHVWPMSEHKLDIWREVLADPLLAGELRVALWALRAVFAANDIQAGLRSGNDERVFSGSYNLAALVSILGHGLRLKRPNDNYDTWTDSPVAKALIRAGDSMRKAIALIACLVIFGCREAKVTSTSYTRADGTVAFNIERYAHGFNLQAVSSSGSPSLTLMKVGMCKSAQLLWNGKDSVLFIHAGAEIICLADGFDSGSNLTIGVCRIGSPNCNLWPKSSTKETIAVSCG